MFSYKKPVVYFYFNKIEMLFKISLRNVKFIIMQSHVQSSYLYAFHRSLLYLKSFYFSEATVQMVDRG